MAMLILLLCESQFLLFRASELKICILCANIAQRGARLITVSGIEIEVLLLKDDKREEKNQFSLFSILLLILILLLAPAERVTILATAAKSLAVAN